MLVTLVIPEPRSSLTRSAKAFSATASRKEPPVISMRSMPRGQAGGVQRDIRRSVYHIGQDLAGVGPTRVRVTKHVDTLFDTDDVAPAKHGGYLVPRVGVILEGSKERQVIEFFSLDLSSQSCDRR